MSLFQLLLLWFLSNGEPIQLALMRIFTEWQWFLAYFILLVRFQKGDKVLLDNRVDSPVKWVFWPSFYSVILIFSVLARLFRTQYVIIWNFTPELLRYYILSCFSTYVKISRIFILSNFSKLHTWWYNNTAIPNFSKFWYI